MSAHEIGSKKAPQSADADEFIAVVREVLPGLVGAQL